MIFNCDVVHQNKFEHIAKRSFQNQTQTNNIKHLLSDSLEHELANDGRTIQNTQRVLRDIDDEMNNTFMCVHVCMCVCV